MFSPRAHDLREHVAGELLVKLNPGHDVSKFSADLGVEVAEEIFMPPSMKAAFGGDLVRVLVSESTTSEALARLEADSRVAYAEPNHIVHGEPAWLSSEPRIAPMRAVSRPSESLVVTALGAELPGLQALGKAVQQGPSSLGLGLAGAALAGLAGALLGSTVRAPLGLAVAGVVVGGWLGAVVARQFQEQARLREQEGRLLEQEAEPVAPRHLPPGLSPELWGLDNLGQQGGSEDADIDAPEAWAVTRGDRNRVIAVLDTGIDTHHPALAGNLWTHPTDGSHGFNTITGQHDPQDNISHGTHCSGTIAGNGVDGVFGVSPRAQLMALKFMDGKEGGKESGTLADAIKAVALATEYGARITSNSWTVGAYNRALRDAYAASPALHIMAAGNEGHDAPLYPAAFGLKNSLAVAATDRHHQLVRCSNYGQTAVDLAAPGADIYSTIPGGGYASKTGTSMATAQVTGVANLVLSAYPDLSNEELKERLMKSSTVVRELNPYLRSSGVVNAARALRPEASEA
jgi:hypothetical protein